MITIKSIEMKNLVLKVNEVNGWYFVELNGNQVMTSKQLDKVMYYFDVCYSDYCKANQ